MTDNLLIIILAIAFVAFLFCLALISKLIFKYKIFSKKQERSRNTNKIVDLNDNAQSIVNGVNGNYT
jgi:uncharacterized membrane protein affecting hemolysin expression